jgi:hypothetical protein
MLLHFIYCAEWFYQSSKVFQSDFRMDFKIGFEIKEEGKKGERRPHPSPL